MNSRSLLVTVVLAAALSACTAPQGELVVETLSDSDWDQGRRGGTVTMAMENLFSLFPPSADLTTDAAFLENFFAMVGPGDREGQRFLSYSGNLDDF